MPLYEYQCDACGHRFEKIQKFSDPIVDTCPICGGAVRKLMSSPAIQFKGSGFYITDYAKKDKGGDKTDSSGSADKAAKSESSAGKGTDDKGGKSEKSAPAAGSDKAGGTSSTAPTSSDSTGGATKAKS
jgi:putative FmdB family regulatory protein